MTDKNRDVKMPNYKALAALNDEDFQLMERFNEKLARKVSFKDRAPAAMEGKPEILTYAHLMETCKSTSANGALQLIANAAAGQHWSDADSCLTNAYAQMVDLAPRTPLEAMLISQMVAVNSAVGKTMQRGMLSEQTFAGKEMNVNLATKLQRTFLMQIDALEKLRGKGQQTVRVEHVTVNAGGQAIVGNVEQRQGGRG